MKRIVYLGACVLLGIVLSFIAHAAVEQVAIALLLSNFDTWSFGLGWDTLFAVHHVFSILTLVAGIVGGYFLGIYWWNLVYVHRKRGFLFKTS